MYLKAKDRIPRTQIEWVGAVTNRTPRMLNLLKRFFLHIATQAEKDEIDDWMQECAANSWYFDLLLEEQHYIETILKNSWQKSQLRPESFSVSLESVFNNVPDMLSVHDQQGYFQMVSESAHKIYSYKPEDLVGKHHLQIVEENFVSNVSNWWFDIFYKKITDIPSIQYSLVLPDKTHLYVETSLSRIPSPSKNIRSGFIAITRVVDDSDDPND